MADGSGGAFIVWRDYRNNNSEADIYMQHLTASGSVAAGWPVGGMPVCTAPYSQFTGAMVADGFGGVILAWRDYRDYFTTGSDVYALRIAADGTLAPGWPTNGLAVCTAPQEQEEPLLVADGTGGAIMVWEDFRDGNAFYFINPDVYAIRVTGDGTLAPGWAVNGMPVAAGPGNEFSPLAVASGEGGAIVVYDYGNDLRAQRVLGDGTIDPQWPPEGLVVCGAREGQHLDAVCSDGASGAFAVWRDYRAYPGFGQGFPYLDVFAQHVTVEGQIAAGWPANGAAVCTEQHGQIPFGIVPDASGGFIGVWQDHRTGQSQVYALRMLGSGTPAPGWPVGGRLVSNLAGAEEDAAIAEDGLGGAYVAFENWPPQGLIKVYTQHLTAGGAIAAGWPAGGMPVSPLGGFGPSLAGSGSAAIVAWGNPDIYAQKLVPDGPVPVLVSLASVEARPEEVVLRWHASEAMAGPATVGRTSGGEVWKDLAATFADGSGSIEFRDRAVVPGQRYGYRLRYVSEGQPIVTPETWVDVPLKLSLALAGFRPNPAVGIPIVALSLPSAEPASLELFDSLGRLVRAKDIASLGAGAHVVPLGADRLSPGIYWLRLQQGTQTLVQRGVVTR